MHGKVTAVSTTLNGTRPVELAYFSLVQQPRRLMLASVSKGGRTLRGERPLESAGRHACASDGSLEFEFRRSVEDPERVLSSLPRADIQHIVAGHGLVYPPLR